jgi:hypothetical protein
VSDVTGCLQDRNMMPGARMICRFTATCRPAQGTVETLLLVMRWQTLMEERPLGRHRRRCDHNIKMVLKDRLDSVD